MIQRQRRHFQYMISSGCLFVILGIGNIVFGCIKYDEYLKSYNQISIEINEAKKKQDKKIAIDNNPEAKIYNTKSFIANRVKHLERSRGRMNFYHFFVTGGKIFLSISFLSFLLAGFLYQKSKKQ